MVTNDFRIYLFWKIVNIVLIWFLLIYFLKNEYNKRKKTNSIKSRKKWKSPYIIDMGIDKRDPKLKQNINYNKSKTNLNKPNLSANYLPYKPKNSILSESELRFYTSLKINTIDTNYIIFPKVRLSDILVVPNVTNYQEYFNKLSLKSIDFILCDKDTFKPIIAIVLDDTNLDLDNDFFKNDDLSLIFKTAALKLVRFNKYYPYKITEIKEKLNVTY